MRVLDTFSCIHLGSLLFYTAKHGWSYSCLIELIAILLDLALLNVYPEVLMYVILFHPYSVGSLCLCIPLLMYNIAKIRGSGHYVEINIKLGFYVNYI